MTSTESPCIGICIIDDHKTCIGCYRTLDDISIWSLASEDQKRQILRAAELRHPSRQANRHHSGSRGVAIESSPRK